uniref:3-beta hydroxysteroid dehydrogenase/isomerase domain-containing protein n=1 Tax=Plectus sambesii TaxID=2011161 RepID=A0A914W817_9BILA
MTNGSGEVIAVTGGNSLIGQHLIKWLVENGQSIAVIRVWHPTQKFVKRIEMDETRSISVEGFVGQEYFERFLDGASTVFNLHEVWDFSLQPNKKKMWEENVNAVERLMTACRAAKVARVVHLSSAFVNTSIRWPNTNLVELTEMPPKSEAPFPDYIDSKIESERIVFEYDDIQTFAVRLCPLIGEGDQSSIVCDALRFAQWNKLSQSLPVIGDRGGVLQITYAGNAASGLARVMEKMIEQPTLTKEVVFVVDDAPKKDVFTFMEPLLEARGVPISSAIRVPFFFAYVLYWLIVSPLLFISQIVPLPSSVARLPSLAVLYMTFYHWTFFSPNKSRLLLDWVPPFDYRQAMRRSAAYYKSLDVASLPESTRSWCCVE